MSGSKSRRKNNKNKKEKNDASPHKVPELIEPQSNQAFQQPEVQIGNKFDGNSESILAFNLECKTEPEWVTDESSIQEIDLGCNTEPEWLVHESLGDKLLVSSPEGRLFSFDSCSSKVCWSVTTSIARHASNQLDEHLLGNFSKACRRYKPQDVEAIFMYVGARDFVCSTSVTKRHVIPRRGSLLSPLTSYSVQKLKEATTDSPSDITLCIKLFDFHMTFYRPGTNIIECIVRHATSIISIVSRDAVRWQGQYLLTPGTHCNVTWSGKVTDKDDKDTVLVGEHNLGIDVICIKKSSDYDVEEEVSIVIDVSIGNLNVCKVYDVVSFQDVYKVTTERCDKGLRERLRELILSSCNDQKILLKLIRGIVTGLIGLHDKRIFLENLDISDIFVDKHSNSKISVISEKTKFPLRSSSKGVAGYVKFADNMLVVGHIIFFGYNGVEYKGEDLTIPNTQIHPNALDLLTKLLDDDPAKRPTAEEAYNHPLFWDPDTSLSFIQDIRVRLREEVQNSDLLKAIENIKPDVFDKRWKRYINVDFLKEMNKHSRYDYSRVRDLIRFIRNDVTYNVKRAGLETDLHTEFPELVIKLYNVMQKHCGEELAFKRYFRRTPL